MKEIKDKIHELESWLKNNDAQHLDRSPIEADLRKYKEQLKTLENASNRL